MIKLLAVLFDSHFNPPSDISPFIHEGNMVKK